MGYSKVVLEEYGGPEVLKIKQETELPEPGPHEVRIRVQASSVAFTDCLVREGTYPGTRGLKPPMTPGYDLVGVVDKVGAAVTTLLVGQKVAELTVTGAYTEYVCLHENRLVPVPNELDSAEAVSMILSYMTAYQMLHRYAKVKRGDKVLITGAGGAVGTALLQLGQLEGLEMYGTESERKLNLVASLGATPINYKTENVSQKVRELSGAGVDAVFDGVGDFIGSYKMLAPHGTLVRYGTAKSGTHWGTATLLSLVGSGIWLALRQLFSKKSVPFYSIAPLRKKQAAWFREDLTALFSLLQQGKIKPVIAERIPMREVARAHQLIENRGVKGKVVLMIEEKG